MSKFKKGDKFKMVNSYGIVGGENYVDGEIYVIGRVANNGTIFVENSDDGGVPYIALEEYKHIKKVEEEEDKKPVYQVTVHNNNGSAFYLTEDEDITYNYRYGNESMVVFICTDGKRVTLPNNVIVEQELFTKG